MEELQRLEADLVSLETRLASAAYLARTPTAVLDGERQLRNELRARLEVLREQLEKARVPVAGGLPADVGRWAPLALFEASAELEPSPPLEVTERERLDYPALERQVAAALLASSRRAAPLIELAREWRSEPGALRLLGAALFSIDRVAKAVSLGAPSRRPMEAFPVEAGPLPWLTMATELPDERDGLTATQRKVLQVMRTAAPPGRAFVQLSALAAEVAEHHPALELPDVEHALIALGHPSLRPFPLVEFQGFSGRFTPPETHFTHARLTPLALDVLADTVPLPLLLLNGAEGRGTTIPPLAPSALLEALTILGQHPQSAVDVGAPDLASGAEVNGNAGRRWPAPLFARARITQELAPDGVRARLVVDRFPWPLRARDVIDELARLKTRGLLDGVTSVEDESSASEVRLVVQVEHVAFAGLIRSELLASRLFEQRLDLDLVVLVAGAPQRLSLVELLRVFLEQRREVAVRRLDAAVAKATLQAQRAEAVCVALALLDPVQAALRDTLDDAEATAALQVFLRPEHRAALAGLPLPLSHDYARGFTEDQARHVATQRRLAARRRDAAVSDWAAALSARDEAKRQLGDRRAVLAVVLAELEAARERFSSPRRSEVRWW